MRDTLQVDTQHDQEKYKMTDSRVRPPYFTLLFIILALFALPIASAQDTTEEKTDPITPEMPMVNEGDYNIVNFLLMGTATENFHSPGLTDSLMIVSVNRDLNLVSVLSLPRDLWVYIDGFGMDKINTAYFYGQLKSEDTTGVELLKEVIRYNLGIEIDYYARINFNGLIDIVDTLGGINIAVDCSLQDWRLKSPELDKSLEENWELYTIWAGVHHIDGETALWYVRSRRTSSDLDRNRRQQDVLRALWRTFRSRGLLTDLPALFNQFDDVIDTDITPETMLSFAPLALQIETGDVNYYGMKIHDEIENAYSEKEGKAILRINQDAAARLIQNFILPPSASQLSAGHPTVALVSASGDEDLVYVAAQRLELEGFKSIIIDEAGMPRQWNHIIDYTGATKGNPIGTIQKVLRVTDEGVEVQPDANRQYNYKVYIGANYGGYACTRNVLPPKPLDENGNVIPTPTPEG